MKSAGIKVWVLTGDKVGTAINIGISAGLLDQKDDMDMHYVLKEDYEYTLKHLLTNLQIKNSRI